MEVYFWETDHDNRVITVLERFGASDGSNRIVCDCPLYGDPELDRQAYDDADKIAAGLNKLLLEATPRKS